MEVAVELEEANAEVPRTADGRACQGDPEESEGQKGRRANDGPRGELAWIADGRVAVVDTEACPVPAVHGSLESPRPHECCGAILPHRVVVAHQLVLLSDVYHPPRNPLAIFNTRPSKTCPLVIL